MKSSSTLLSAFSLVGLATACCFTDTCSSWSVDQGENTYLVDAECSDGLGNVYLSELDLNDCLGNDFGTLVLGKNFGYTCPSCTVIDNVFYCECENGSGGEPESGIVLDDFVTNSGGFLTC